MRIYPFVLTLLLSVQAMPDAHAQKRTIPGVMPKGFTGITRQFPSPFYTLSYYMDRPGDERDFYMQEMLNDTLGNIGRVNLELNKNEEVIAVSAGGPFTLFVTGNKGKKTMTYMLRDMQGNTVAQHEDKDVPASAFNSQSRPAIVPVMPDQYAVIAPASNGNSGYSMKLFDRELNEKWTKSFFPANGNWLIDQIFTEGESVYILRREKPNTGRSSFSLVAINTMRGDTMFTRRLQDDEGHQLYPSFFDREGGFNVGGLYYNPGNTSANADGIFATMMGPGGDMHEQRRLPWSALAEKLDAGFNKDLATGNLSLYPVSFTRNMRGKQVLTAEVIRRQNSASNEATLSFKDVALLYINDTGGLDKIEIIEGSPRQAVVKGSLASESIAELGAWLKPKDVFTFKGAMRTMGAQYIAYRKDENNKSQLWFHAIDSPAMQQIAPISLLPENTDSKGKTTEPGRKPIAKYAFNTNEEPKYDNENPLVLTGVLPGMSDKVMLYYYSTPTLEMWVKTLAPVPAAKTAK